MKFKILRFSGMIILIFFMSCNKGNYLQEFKNYNQFNKVENPRLKGWFPTELIKPDAKNIKNRSYLSTKCIFGVFDYENEELYDSIFNDENSIDKTHNEIFQKQIESVKNIIPEWFPKIDYWKTKKVGIILFDNYFAYRDLKKKQIYYFHPEERSTFINGKIYPDIRKSVR